MEGNRRGWGAYIVQTTNGKIDEHIGGLVEAVVVCVGGGWTVGGGADCWPPIKKDHGLHFALITSAKVFRMMKESWRKGTKGGRDRGTGGQGDGRGSGGEGEGWVGGRTIEGVRREWGEGGGKGWVNDGERDHGSERVTGRDRERASERDSCRRGGTTKRGHVAQRS